MPFSRQAANRADSVRTCAVPFGRRSSELGSSSLLARDSLAGPAVDGSSASSLGLAAGRSWRSSFACSSSFALASASAASCTGYHRCVRLHAVQNLCSSNFISADKQAHLVSSSTIARAGFAAKLCLVAMEQGAVHLLSGGLLGFLRLRPLS